MTTAIQKWGNSLALRIPSAVARQLRVENGDAVEMSVQSGALTIRAARPRYQLADLVKGIQPGNTHEEVDWGTSVGQEV
jgi:antitoxin MazE